jgi:hypothetical protein
MVIARLAILTARPARPIYYAQAVKISMLIFIQQSDVFVKMDFTI